MKSNKHKIREDKSCLNCGAFVDKRFCPKCGQENKESRESFFLLIWEFFSDFVHFDSSFWKTTKYLLFSPAKLSLEYMAGKRKSYVAPVKLYIFVSFLAFFVPILLPTTNESSSVEKIDTDSIAYVKLANTKVLEQRIDSLNSTFVGEKDKATRRSFKSVDLNEYGQISSVAQLDSVHNSKGEGEKVSLGKYYFWKSLVIAAGNLGDERNREKAREFMTHNLPKVLFVYMPLFAFFMWLFNLNRRKFYFDSGIFTLHFFSFMLIIITIYNILAYVFDTWVGYNGLGILLPVMLLYTLFYFFRANRIFYAEKRWIANIKALLFVFINNILMVIITVLYVLFVFTRHYN